MTGVPTDPPVERPSGPAPAGPRDPRVVELLDPVAALLAGAFAYADRPAALPDEQAVPALRVRRQVGAEGLRLTLDSQLDDDAVASHTLEVERLPLDRDAVQVVSRRHPAPTSCLVVRAGQPADELAGVPGVAAAVGEAGVLALDPSGPVASDRGRVVDAARDHRMVLLDGAAAGDPVRWAALVLALAGAGVACWAPAHAAAHLALLAPELRAALTADPSEALADDLALAARAAAQGRAAWWGHDLRLGWDVGRGGTDHGVVPVLRPVAVPSLAVLLVSRRPALVPAALAMVAAQREVRPEVVVALHGAHDPGPVTRLLAELDLDGRVLALPASVPFGGVLNEAVAAADAPLVTKWDDDDLYGPDHLRDLLVARRRSRAELVGKAPEFVYFERTDETVWRRAAKAESFGPWIAGGTFLTDRAVLEDIGGFPDVVRAVDHHPKFRILARGGRVYRTHGFGFALRRHGRGHTWEAPDDALRARAVRRFDGMPPLVGLGDAARWTQLPGHRDA